MTPWLAILLGMLIGTTIGLLINFTFTAVANNKRKRRRYIIVPEGTIATPIDGGKNYLLALPERR